MKYEVFFIEQIEKVSVVIEADNFRITTSRRNNTDEIPASYDFFNLKSTGRSKNEYGPYISVAYFPYNIVSYIVPKK